MREIQTYRERKIDRETDKKSNRERSMDREKGRNIQDEV